ncbi:MAG: hypothetical protein ACRDMV_03025 [Streptosporangiales bacterium]
MPYFTIVISFLPAVVFAAGIVFALVTMQRQPRRSTFALIGFLVLLVGYLAVRIYQLAFFPSDPGDYLVSILVSQFAYIVVFAVGLAMLVGAVFAVPSQRPGAPAAPPAWGPPHAQAPQPGWPGGNW